MFLKIYIIYKRFYLLGNETYLNVLSFLNDIRMEYKGVEVGES